MLMVQQLPQPRHGPRHLDVTYRLYGTNSADAVFLSRPAATRKRCTETESRLAAFSLAKL